MKSNKKFEKRFKKAGKRLQIKNFEDTSLTNQITKLDKSNTEINKLPYSYNESQSNNLSCLEHIKNLLNDYNNDSKLIKEEDSFLISHEEDMNVDLTYNPNNLKVNDTILTDYEIDINSGDSPNIFSRHRMDFDETNILMSKEMSNKEIEKSLWKPRLSQDHEFFEDTTAWLSRPRNYGIVVDNITGIYKDGLDLL